VQSAYVVGPQFGSAAPDLMSWLDKAKQILTKAGPYLDTVVDVVQDPALPQLVTRIKTLKALQAKAPETSTAPAKPGVGLDRALPLLDAAIFYTKYPWAPWAIGAGVVVVLGGIGFGIGRATKRRRTR
jgi:hypothetical protein